MPILDTFLPTCTTLHVLLLLSHSDYGNSVNLTIILYSTKVSTCILTYFTGGCDSQLLFTVNWTKNYSLLKKILIKN